MCVRPSREPRDDQSMVALSYNSAVELFRRLMSQPMCALWRTEDRDNRDPKKSRL